MLYLHNSGRILTALINIQVSTYHRVTTRTVESARKAFYCRKISSKFDCCKKCRVTVTNNLLVWSGIEVRKHAIGFVTT